MGRGSSDRKFWSNVRVSSPPMRTPFRTRWIERLHNCDISNLHCSPLKSLFSRTARHTFQDVASTKGASIEDSPEIRREIASSSRWRCDPLCRMELHSSPSKRTRARCISSEARPVLTRARADSRYRSSSAEVKLPLAAVASDAQAQTTPSGSLHGESRLPQAGRGI